MEQQLFDMLVNKNDISWKALIYDLIRSQRMDPWDINITVLAQQYVDRLKKLKELDLKVSGKVLLAAAILLKIKSKKLLGDDLLEFDRLLAGQPDEEAFYDELQQEVSTKTAVTNEVFPLYSRTPQPRKRKVSVFELLHALEKALEVKNRRLNRLHDIVVQLPEKKEDIGVTLQNLFTRIIHVLGRGSATFDSILETRSREEKIRTFIPILYLSNERKIRLKQEYHFGDIVIELGTQASVG